MKKLASRKWRYLSVALLIVIFGSASCSLEHIPGHSKPGEPILFLGKYVLTFAPLNSQGVPEYVLSKHLEVWDTSTELRVAVAELAVADRVYANGHYRYWFRVYLANGKVIGANEDAYMSETSYQAGQGLF